MARVTVGIPASQHQYWMSELGLGVLKDKKIQVQQVRYRYSVAKSVKKMGLSAQQFKGAVKNYRKACTYTCMYTSPTPYLHYLYLTYTYTDGDKKYVSLLAHYGVGSGENWTTDYDKQMELVKIIWEGKEVAAALAEPAAAAAAATVQKEEKKKTKKKNPTYVHLTYT